MENLKGKQGNCPYCNSDNLEYGTFGFDDTGGYYETECNDCKKHFNETYDFTFVGNWGEKED